MATVGMLFTGCAVDDTMQETNNNSGYEEFYVMDMTPAYNVTTSDSITRIDVAFNMPVDSSTVLGNFTLVENINGIPTDLTPQLTVNLDTTGSILSLGINGLADRADYTLSMNQAVKSLGSGKFLRSAISHKFNTGGGFLNDNGSGSVPGKPFIVSKNYIRTCYIDGNGQEVHRAHIEVRFNEPLAFAPVVDVQVANDGSNNYQVMPMTQLNGGDLTLMKVDVPSIGGLQGYKIRFQHNYVRDWEGLFMDSYESNKMYQALVQCHPL